MRGNSDAENFKLDETANIKELQVCLQNERFLNKKKLTVFFVQVKGPLNFLTLCYVKTLIQLQLESVNSPAQRKGLFKKNKVVPSSILKVNIVDELKEDGRITNEEEFIQTRRLCGGPDSSGDSDQENTMIETAGPPGRRIILNLSPVTWMDVAGCEVIAWLSDRSGLDGVVVDSSLEVGLSSSGMI